MKWIKHYNNGNFGGLACSGTNAYVSDDSALVIVRFNTYFANKTPWMLRELRDGQTYYPNRDFIEIHGYATLKEAKQEAEEYAKRKMEVV